MLPPLTKRDPFAYIARSSRPASWRIHQIPKVSVMSRRCELTGVGPMVGHNVSHSNIKTKRRFLPSLKTVKVASEALGQTFSLRISNAALRTLDFKGGLDPFIVKAKDEQLSLAAQRIKRQVKARIAEQAAAA